MTVAEDETWLVERASGQAFVGEWMSRGGLYEERTGDRNVLRRVGLRCEEEQSSLVESAVFESADIADD